MRKKPKKKEGTNCSACGSKFFSVTLSDKEISAEVFKPLFHCLNCTHSWSSGRNGQPYIEFAKIVIP